MSRWTQLRHLGPALSFEGFFVVCFAFCKIQCTQIDQFIWFILSLGYHIYSRKSWLFKNYLRISYMSKLQLDHFHPFFSSVKLLLLPTSSWIMTSSAVIMVIIHTYLQMCIYTHNPISVAHMYKCLQLTVLNRGLFCEENWLPLSIYWLPVALWNFVPPMLACWLV